jgi:hypothetical protein
VKAYNCRPIAHVGDGRFRNVAILDAEILEGLNIVGLKLALAPDGRKFVFGPEVRGQRFLKFSGDYPRQLADAAWDALGGCVANVGR